MKPATMTSSEMAVPANQGLSFIVGFFFCFRSAISISLIDLFGANPQTGSETRLALSFFLLVLVCFTLGPRKLSFGSVSRLSSIRWVLAFLVFSGCSLFWSDAASLVASGAYWCGTVCDVVIVFLLFRSGTVTVTAESMMRGFLWATCGIALIGWLMPTQYDFRLGNDDFFNSNTIGNICVFGIFFAQYLTRRKAEKWGLVTFFLVTTLLRSLSKSAIAAFLVSEIFLILQDKAMSRKTKMKLALGAVLMVLLFWGLIEAYYDFYTSYGNEAQTLTGRTSIWVYVFNGALERPWVGHGFDSMWNVIPAFGGFQARHAENELLEQFYSYGTAGIILLCGVYGSLLRAIRRFTQNSQRVVLISILLYVVVRGLVIADAFDLMLPLWMAVLIGVLVGDADARQPAEIVEPISAGSASPRMIAV
jgi:exopolysaccharide production protein ExoQ